ncbi:hypothetical protein FH972_024493 [Carpinus fangiana]|uniref:SH3 domain-containing protein n=1 Tax=Carpinus fangiana TaxID=176857 RepID=A0A5N6KY62_9ROSI|nr:hypothetical protein FH972_024493 [Carpinus fangiana]
MVLLDDSNSYWWLVRVVKDSSIGYLPAEHIETPTERLARLNKHRNIDLAQSMLGDNPERSKNPLKKAMRRRNAKIVQFTAPTYFEPPENDWSDEEADDDSGDIGMAEHQDTASSEDDKPDANGADADQADEGQATAQTQKTLNQPEAGDVGQESRASGDQESVGEESTERRTRNGTIRNTDSFFKDDTVEPRKISLTPNLLREENGTRTSDSKDSAASTSQENIFDTLDRSDSTSSDKSRDGKNKKDKKPGMLSGLFKRKDKKIKVDEAVGGVVTKQGAADVPLSPSAIVTSEPLSPTLASPTSPVAPTVASLKKGPNKLAKAPPSSAASSNSATAPALAKSSSVTSLRGARDDRKTADGSVAAAASTGVSGDTRQPLNLQIPTGDGEQKPSSGLLSPLTNLVNSDQPKKEKLKKAKTRMELDVDSSPEAEEAKDNPFNDTAHIPQAGPSPGRPPPTAPFTADLSEKDVDGVDYRGPSHDTGGEEQASILAADVQPRMTHSASSGESDPDAPHTPIMHQTRATFEGGSSLTTGTPGGSVSMSSPAASTPATTANSEGRDSWDGAALRTYLDGSSTNDVKDMLVIINDHTGVVPVGHDHPVMVELGLQEQQRKLDALSAQLDGLLQGFLEKRRATRAAAAAATTSSTATAAS